MPMPRILQAGVRPMPLLMINDRMEVTVVDDKGNWIANITDRSGYAIWAQRNLSDAGYSTDWAEWDQDGAFVRLT